VSFIRQHFANENFYVATIGVAGNRLHWSTPTTLEQKISGRNTHACRLVGARIAHQRSQPLNAALSVRPRKRSNVGGYSFSRQ